MGMKADNFPKWFFDNNTVDDFAAGLAEFKGKKNLKFLQIGVFTGNASVWMLENILTDKTSLLVDVDPWCGNLQHESVYDWNDLARTYSDNLDHIYTTIENFKNGCYLSTKYFSEQRVYAKQPTRVS